MSQMLNIGKKFEDFSSLEIAIQQYQKEKMFNSLGPVREPLKRLSHGCQTKNLKNVFNIMKYYFIVYAAARTLNPGVRE